MKIHSSLTLMFGLIAAAGCSSATSAESTDTADVTTRSCASKLGAEVLKRAREISEDASITSRSVLYADGDNAYADAVLVRVSDETEPSDYLVFRSRLQDGVVQAQACNLEDTALLGTGVLPGDVLVTGSFGASCAASVQDAVLAKARLLNEEAHVTATKRLYGGDSVWAGGVVLVRVSDEVEPSDYIATYHVEDSAQANAGRCTVDLAKIVNSGMLPEIAGLVSTSKAPTCKAPDGSVLEDGASFKLDCNACTCRRGGLTCTEMMCAPSP